MSDMTSTFVPAAHSPEEWRGIAVSMIGNGHIRREMQCQDASAAIVMPRPALIVCDGRGSAKAGLSQEGSREAVRAFCAQLNVLEPVISEFLDRGKLEEIEWRNLCRILYRTLVQAKLECANDTGLPENEFDFTAAFAVVGKANVGCFQVGDGALVLQRGSKCETVFKPMKGEFANLTQFVRSDGESRDEFLAAVFPAEGITGVAATSDGPQYLMFNLLDMSPGPAFPVFFDRMSKGELERDEILAYLSRRKWADDPRGDDDRSVALLCKARRRLYDNGEPKAESVKTAPESKEFAKKNSENQGDTGNAPVPELIHCEVNY